MTLDRADRRFVESQAVLEDHDASTSPSGMPWEDFEHLASELFAMMFSYEDAEGRVALARADGGVDAVAFDPDPIRGGKFVIQAKRYTKVVPVAAVRDLYGTTINEGAAKGILVTTAHHGRASRAFAQDKPLTLIDGSNLVYLLEQHGHEVRIDIEAARRTGRASP
jgi:restriction system protein